MDLSLFEKDFLSRSESGLNKVLWYLFTFKSSYHTSLYRKKVAETICMNYLKYSFFKTLMCQNEARKLVHWRFFLGFDLLAWTNLLNHMSSRIFSLNDDHWLFNCSNWYDLPDYKQLLIEHRSNWTILTSNLEMKYS